MILYIRIGNSFKNNSTIETVNITTTHPFNLQNIISSVSITYGDEEIDRHYSSWLNIWNELTELTDNSAKPFKKIDHDKLIYKPLKDNFKHI
jgi:hypothetical protein